MRSIFRTLLVTAIIAGCAFMVFRQLREDIREQQIRELEATNAEMRLLLSQRQAMLDRLSHTRRIAHIEVLDQRRNQTTGEVEETTLRFVEVDEHGRELGRRDYTIKGGILFIDAWTAKFHHGDVAHGHPLRGRTIVLLRRLYSEHQAPAGGARIDTPGSIPDGYAGSDIATFEQQIWKNFWRIADDPELAARFGVRIAQGEVVYRPIHAGEIYQLHVDAAGGMNILRRATRRDADARLVTQE